jgi:hypothetical protein
MPKQLLTKDAIRGRVDLYLNAGERSSLVAKAKETGLSLSAYVRRAALGHKVASVPVANAQRWQELARLAGNLNQLARAINTGSATGIDQALIDNLQSEVRELRRALIGVIQ